MDKEAVEEVALHLLKTIACEMGRVNIRELTNHFSQLLADLRKKFNSSKEIKGLLMKYPEIFVVKKELVNEFPERDLHGFAAAFPVRAASPHINAEIDDDNAGETEDDDEEDEEDYEQMSGNADISIDGKGRIVKRFDKYGFIQYSSHNYRTVIFFDVRAFENGQHVILGDLQLNERVYFRAKRSFGHSAPYRATAVWRPGYYLSPRDTRKCYSSSASIASQDSFQSDDMDGTLEATKSTENYGYIRARKQTQEDDLLFLSKPEPPSLEKAKSVDDFLEIEDFVYFSGRRMEEEVKISETPKNASKHRTEKTKGKKQVKSTNTDYSGHKAGSNISETYDRNPHSSKPDRMEQMVDSLYSQVGKIYDLAENQPVINFGRNEKAIVQPNTIYKNGKLVRELGWEIDDGTEVQFDAKHVSGNWRAVLVWVGDKPEVSNERSYQKNNTHSKEDLLQELGDVSLHDDEHSGGIRRYRSYPHIGASSWSNPPDESLISDKNRPRGAKSSKAENYPKIPPAGDNSKKKFTKYRKNNNTAEARSSAARGRGGYYQ